MSWFGLVIICVASAAVTWALTWLVLRVLTRRRILDTPNERSSHSAPTPRGGGLALIPVILVSWTAVSWHADMLVLPLVTAIAGAAGLALISWFDDLHGLPPVPRLLAQSIAVALGLYGLESLGPVFQGYLPPAVDLALAGIAWLWFVNLFNFMDGIDGISGVEAGSIGIGLALTGALFGGSIASVWMPGLLAAATLGFLVWNWPPAKLFLGDVGSVPLGYLLGFLLLSYAAEGQWAVALILPLYYLADATITLIRRGMRGAKVWQAHREHFYQRAVQCGTSHALVSLGVLACNTLLIGCALVAASGQVWLGLAASAAVVAGFLSVLRRWSNPA